MNFLRLLALAVLVSCHHTFDVSTETSPVPPISPPQEEVAHQASTPIGPEYPVADVKKVFTVKIEDTNYTTIQREKLRRVEVLLVGIFNSPEYKSEVLTRKFSSTDLSSAEIYEKLFRGAEGLQPAVNYQMDLKVTMYTRTLSKVVGYTNPDTLVVHTNSKFHNTYSVCKIASNLVHEWTHKIGFDHSSVSDSTSVPYAHNSIIEKLCVNFN